MNANTSADELKKKYYELAKKHHPDSQGGKTDSSQERFKQITEAYDILGNPDLRKEYDSARDVEQRQQQYADPDSGFNSNR